MIEDKIKRLKYIEKIKDSLAEYENHEGEYFHVYLKQNKQRLD